VFDLSVGKLFVLGLVALFVLGPERLPAAAAWLGQAIRRAREFSSGATEQLRRELGPELAQLQQPLNELRVPLQQLQALRNPRAAIARHLLDYPLVPVSAAEFGPVIASRPGPAAAPTLAPGAVPPYDPDAT